MLRSNIVYDYAFIIGFCVGGTFIVVLCCVIIALAVRAMSILVREANWSYCTRDELVQEQAEIIRKLSDRIELDPVDDLLKQQVETVLKHVPTRR